MINEKALKEEIASLQVTVNGLRAGKGVLKEFMEQFRASVLRIIDEQPKVGEWIPCSERLPERRGLYIATYNCEGDITVDVMLFMGKQFYYPEDMIGCHGKSADVLAWKPLPEPYEEEE